MKKRLPFFLVSLFTLAGITSNPANAQWSAMNVGTCQHIQGLHCPTDGTCYIVGSYGYMRKSTDAGTNWTYLNSGTTTDITCVYFVDELTGYVCGASGLIMKTIDGGQNWTTQTTPDAFANYFWAITFLDANTGFVGGDSGGFYKTTDGGTTWNKITIPGAGSIGEVQFLDANTGYITVGTFNIKKTVDGGATWSDIAMPYFTSTATSLHFPSANTGYVLGGNGRVNVTNDGGVTWDSTITITSGEAMWDIFFVSDQKGYALANNGVIWTTQDGGGYWGLSAWPTTNALTHLFFRNPNQGYATGVFNSAVRYGSFTAVPEIPEGANISLFPNPMSESTTLRWTESVNADVTLLDMEGRQIRFWGEVPGGQLEINRAHLPAGMYFVTVQTEHELLGTLKLIIK